MYVRTLLVIIFSQVQQLDTLDTSTFIQVLGEFGPQNAAVALQVREISRK
jgi:hypothetical protein